LKVKGEIMKTYLEEIPEDYMEEVSNKLEESVG